MDLVARYIYAVTARLPANQREDIEKELKGLIEDMLSERAGDQGPTKKDIEAVLLELGEPSRLADQYRGSKRFLIGPEYFDKYLLVVKIVVAAVAFGLTLALIIGYMVNPPQNLWEAFGGYIASMLAAIVQSFAWVTLVFAVFEHYGVKLPREKAWSPADLPHIPDQQALIKPWEPILGIVFTVFLIILFNAANQLIGAYIVGENSQVTVIPLFSRAAFGAILPLFNVLFALSIVKEGLKFMIGKWTAGLAGIITVLNVASLILVIFIFSNQGIWNEAFALYFLRSGLLPANLDPNTIWTGLSKGLITIVAFALAIETVSSLAKALKHRIASYLWTAVN